MEKKFSSLVIENMLLREENMILKRQLSAIKEIICQDKSLEKHQFLSEALSRSTDVFQHFLNPNSKKVDSNSF